MEEMKTEAVEIMEKDSPTWCIEVTRLALQFRQQGMVPEADLLGDVKYLELGLRLFDAMPRSCKLLLADRMSKLNKLLLADGMSPENKLLLSDLMSKLNKMLVANGMSTEIMLLLADGLSMENMPPQGDIVNNEGSSGDGIGIDNGNGGSSGDGSEPEGFLVVDPCCPVIRSEGFLEYCSPIKPILKDWKNLIKEIPDYTYPDEHLVFIPFDFVSSSGGSSGDGIGINNGNGGFRGGGSGPGGSSVGSNGPGGFSGGATGSAGFPGGSSGPGDSSGGATGSAGFPGGSSGPGGSLGGSSSRVSRGFSGGGSTSISLKVRPREIKSRVRFSGKRGRPTERVRTSVTVNGGRVRFTTRINRHSQAEE